ncbi:unnamed protein product [Lymnaea stagnalis]|uniref:Uncharacterized protein n=1 Tax=Lymnaea stagnalis TaxID=6523 RepID=A0AAV2H7T6_LYMST
MRTIFLLLGLLVLFVTISPSEQRRRFPKHRKPAPQQAAPPSNEPEPEPTESEFDRLREEVERQFFLNSNPKIRYLKKMLRDELVETTVPPPPEPEDECGGCGAGHYCHPFHPDCEASANCAEVTYVCSPVRTTTEEPVVSY